mgnify:CR=1 FL=1
MLKPLLIRKLEYLAEMHDECLHKVLALTNLKAQDACYSTPHFEIIADTLATRYNFRTEAVYLFMTNRAELSAINEIDPMLGALCEEWCNGQ